MHDQLTSISRRAFIKYTGYAGAASLFLTSENASSFYSRVKPGIDPWTFVAIGRERPIRFFLARTEMGQGIKTAFAMIVADEMEVKLADIDIQLADADSRYGWQMTVGSGSIKSMYRQLRITGAAIRNVMIKTAASGWQVDESECVAKEGVVFHKLSGRQSSYFELIDKVSKQAFDDDVVLKAPKNFNLIGRNRHSVDVTDIVQGKLNYVGDLAISDSLGNERPGSITKLLVATSIPMALLKTAPSEQLIQKMLQEQKISKLFLMPDPSKPGADLVVIMAPYTWPVLNTKSLLIAKLGRQAQLSPAENEFTKAVKAFEYQEKQGVDLQMDFYTPHVAQAPMEPLACIAYYKGAQCELWAPTQAPQAARKSVAQTLGLAEDKVILHGQQAGGGFGRKRYADYIVEAAAIAQTVGGVVKLTWTREDDLQRERYRPAVFQRMTWSQQTPQQIDYKLLEAVGPGTTAKAKKQANIDFLNFAFTGQKSLKSAAYITGIWRSVQYGYMAFAVGSFLDELSYVQHADPIEFFTLQIKDTAWQARIKSLIKPRNYAYNSDRLHGVVNDVRKFSHWQKKIDQGIAIGFCAYYCFHSYIAMVAEVSIVNDRLVVNNVWASVDCGLAVNPDGVRAQIEGGVAYALSACLLSEMPMTHKVSNFDKYRVLRISHMPQIHVSIIDNDYEPSGVGEIAVPPVAAAVNNAFRRKLGRRFQRMPFLKENDKINWQHTVEPSRI